MRGCQATPTTFNDSSELRGAKSKLCGDLQVESSLETLSGLLLIHRHALLIVALRSLYIASSTGRIGYPSYPWQRANTQGRHSLLSILSEGLLLSDSSSWEERKR